MICINQSATIFGELDYENAGKRVELAGRVCYKSEHKISENSHLDFAKMIRKRGHLTVLEHAHFITRVSMFMFLRMWILRPRYFKFTFHKWRPIVSANARAILERADERKIFTRYMNTISKTLDTGAIFPLDCEGRPFRKLHVLGDINLFHPEQLIHSRRTVRFILSRGTGNELVRHREATFSQESTRYVKYTKDKSGQNEIIAIIPQWIQGASQEQFDMWKQSIEASFDSYCMLIDNKVAPQNSRGVLPLDLKTEIVMTTNLEHWIKIFGLRCASDAHPDMIVSMTSVKEEIYKQFHLTDK